MDKPQWFWLSCDYCGGYGFVFDAISEDSMDCPHCEGEGGWWDSIEDGENNDNESETKAGA